VPSIPRDKTEACAAWHPIDKFGRAPAFRPKLSGTTFQRDLGSLLDKAERVEVLLQPLAEATGLTEALATAQQVQQPGNTQGDSAWMHGTLDLFMHHPASPPYELGISFLAQHEGLSI